MGSNQAVPKVNGVHLRNGGIGVGPLKYQFAGISMLSPFVVVGGWLVAEHSTLGNAFNGYLGLFLAAFLYIGTVIGLGAGFISGIIALIRGGENKSLAIVGLVLNFIAGLWVLNGMKWN